MAKDEELKKKKLSEEESEGVNGGAIVTESMCTNHPNNSH